MFSKVGNLNMGMVTRSMSQAGSGFMPRVQPIMETSFSGAASSTPKVNVTSPVNIPRNTPSSNVNLMTSSPNTSVQFGRDYATRFNLSNTESGDLGSRPSTARYVTQYINPLYTPFSEVDLSNPTAPSTITSSGTLSTLNQRTTSLRQQ